MTYYMGTTGGGLWKTTDAGQQWSNISDGYFKTGSVGAVAVSESDPNVVYCGMGEHAIRGVMTSYGDGVYKSIDGGRTWKKMGLNKTAQISRIVVHPKNPDIVYVAAQGAYQAPTPERGVYKSTDGGDTWEKVLFVNELTGAAELSMDVNYPNILYAAMWEHQRTPWKMISGGSGSGLYKSTDSGETWTEMTEGLPKEKGKMAISVSPANSDRVFALIESDSYTDKSGLYVSNNAGEKWKQVSGDNRLTQRAWYYIEVFTDPNDQNVVYVMSADALRSIDGGKTWESIEGTHGDFHNLWINPDNSKNMVIANDGGAAVSFNYGESWSSQDNIPTAQIYRINADNLFPYNIYGGQQDNTSVKIANLSINSRGISQSDWSASAGGESAFLAFDPDNPRFVMGGSYLGTVEILDTKSKAATNVMEAPIQYLGREARDMKYLFDWNAPIIWSKHNNGTFYHGAQLVLKTEDKGLNWEEISPDLTRNLDEKQGNGGGPYTNEAVGAENYGALSYIVESTLEEGVLYTGSNDGKVYLTQNNGETWTDVTPKNVDESLINAIEVSPHDPATAYIATTRYKFNDYTPALYKTTNYGKSWKAINDGIPDGAFTRVVREDPERKDLLYAGTETGMYISWNGGDHWDSFQLNLPITPITDLLVHKGDLIVATSGRSFWILDDLSLLEEYNSKKETNTPKIFTPEPALYSSWGSPLNGNTDDFNGTEAFEGVNPANGVVLYYDLPELQDSVPVTIEIRNAKNEWVRSFKDTADSTFTSYAGGPSAAPLLSKKKGLNRFVWNMRYPTVPGVPEVYIEASYAGHRASPGTYSITLKYGKNQAETTAIIIKNPNYEVSDEQYATYDTFMIGMEQLLTTMHTKVNRLYKAQQELKNVLQALKKDKKEQKLIDAGKKLLADLKEWDNKMVQRRAKAYDDVENFPNKFTAEYIYLINQTESTIPRVNMPSQKRKAELEAQWQTLNRQADTFINTAIPAFNKQLWEAGIGAIQVN
ncbi:MAG TPA: glycosyl hydrolase [Leeuwenhoekiella sp.]|nr:glycosyl hydrolase [Leeuwenhoekiella sp.]